jgi:hypothetical protein
MKNVSIQVPYYLEEIKSARESLDSLYDWLSDSPTGTNEDADGLDLAINVLGKIERQLEREANDGF